VDRTVASQEALSRLHPRRGTNVATEAALGPFVGTGDDVDRAPDGGVRQLGDVDGAAPFDGDVVEPREEDADLVTQQVMTDRSGDAVEPHVVVLWPGPATRVGRIIKIDPEAVVLEQDRSALLEREGVSLDGGLEVVISASAGPHHGRGGQHHGATGPDTRGATKRPERRCAHECEITARALVAGATFDLSGASRGHGGGGQ